MRKFLTGYLIAAFIIAALLAGCVTAATAADGWTTRQDPRGFALDVPPGWSLAYDTAHRAAQVSGSDGTRVVIRVVTTKQAVGQNDGAAEGATLAKQTDAAVAWPAAHLVSPVIATYDATGGTGRSGKAYFTWASSPAMSIGYLYEASGDPAAFANDRAIIARVFSSYRILRAQPSATGTAPATQYQTFNEPQEHMYTVDLPTGWTRTGGAYRKSALDIRPAFRASQTGAMIASGDPQIPFFAIPNRMTAMGNLREGSWYDAGPGVRLMLRRYTDGATFAQQYARTNYGASCANFQFANVRNRQDAVAQLGAVYARLGLPTQINAGEAAFTCTRNGVAMQGYVFAATQQETMGGMGMWSVPVLLTYFATPDRSASAHAALDRAVATYHIDDAWAARNIQTAQKISEITTSTGHAISKIISDTYWSKAESENRTFEKLDDAARGVQNAIDPRTQDRIKIDDRYEYNFINPYGKILGSDVDALPGPQFQRILLTQ
jgi:hypothetical protein